MDFIRNFPFFSIFICMSSGVINSVLKGKTAKKVSLTVIVTTLILSLATLYYVMTTGTSYVYIMGHHPAPWGNEIRFGVLEAVFATFFTGIMLLSVVGGLKHIEEDIEKPKQNLYYVMVNLLMASILALVYTNDLFTAYVFVEINTIAACAIIMIRSNGHCMVAAMKYMIMSLLGSGLILIGLTLLYDITGHLLMSNIQQSIAEIVKTGSYHEPLVMILALISVGLAMKSALFPFHSWLPDAYGYSTATSSAILSSLVSKAYIFLLIKIFYRVIGFDVVSTSKILNVLFTFGILGMIIGSVSAIKETDIRRMIAFSSVAQIGYIYMGIGLGTKLGMIAALFHILSHSASKSMLFISASGLSEVSGDSKDFKDLRGSAHRNKIAGLAFVVGAFSMVGIPLFAGFISKVYFASAGIEATNPKMMITLIVLAISTILNAMYFLRAVITIYRPAFDNRHEVAGYKPSICMCAALIAFVILNFILGMGSDYIIRALYTGIDLFS